MSNDKPSQAQRPTTIDLPDLPATSDPTQIKMMSPSPEPRAGEQNYPTNVTLDPAASGTGQGAAGSSSSSSGGSSSGAGSSRSGSAGSAGSAGSGRSGTAGGGAGNS